MAKRLHRRKTLLKLIILTGKLGSGKTTILNSLKQSFPKKHKIGIVMNEFAIIDIDSQETNAQKSLKSGCVCCTRKEDLIQTLNEMKEYDFVILETTGLANLNQLLQVLQSHQISEIIYVIDSYAYEKSKGFDEATKAQIKGASLVVLNKQDLTQKDTMKLLEKEVKEITGAQIVKTAKKLSFKELTLNAKKPQIKTSLLKQVLPELDPQQRHIQKQKIKSISYKTSNYISQQKIEELITKYNIIRAKGYFSDGKQTYKLNYASGLYYFEKTSKKLDSFELVFIGKFSIKTRYNLLNELDKNFKEYEGLKSKLRNFLASL